MQRFVVVTAGLIALLAVLPPWMAHAAGATPGSAAPYFNPGNFSHPTIINNAYYPLFPGTTFTYQGTNGGGAQTEEMVVTNKTAQVLGITSVVVMDTDALTGAVTEITQDWYAQDNAGNVWYMGEYATQYHNGHVTGHSGSWEGGVSGAMPGVVMLAHPDVGDAYRQEYQPGVAEDHAKVLSLTQSVCVPYDCYYGDALQTLEWSPLEPGVRELKYYAPGVGEVQSTDYKGGSEQMQLVKIQH